MNDKQLKFCNLVLDGVKQFEAYQEVYKVKNEGTARTNSSKLLTNANIIEYMETQRAKLDINNILTREYKLKKLKEIMDNPESQSLIIQSISTANKMQGHDAPIQTEVIDNSHKDMIQVIVNNQSEADDIKMMLDRAKN